jgi:hypothetical protein
MRENVTDYVMPNHEQEAKSFCWQTVSTCVRLDILVDDIAARAQSRVFHDSPNSFLVPTCIRQLRIDRLTPRSSRSRTFSIFLRHFRVLHFPCAPDQIPVLHLLVFFQTSFWTPFQSGCKYQTTVRLVISLKRVPQSITPIGRLSADVLFLFVAVGGDINVHIDAAQVNLRTEWELRTRLRDSVNVRPDLNFSSTPQKGRPH